MKKLIEGVEQFQQYVVSHQREFYEGLARGQKPLALFITCSDSRVNPNLLTQTEPGELFILKNAGNIVPRYSPEHIGGEAATIEFAVNALGVRNIVVCGHSHCGAMQGLMSKHATKGCPGVERWLAHAEPAQCNAIAKYPDLRGDELDEAIAEENVLVQMENLRTHPSVAAAEPRGEVGVYGWVYKIDSGEVLAYEPLKKRFVHLGEAAVPAM